MGTTIFDQIKAVDIDAGVNGLAEYFVVPFNGSLEEENAEDGFGYFSIALPHQGQVTVNRSLDYERAHKYLVTVVASVSIAYIISFICFTRYYLKCFILPTFA